MLGYSHSSFSRARHLDCSLKFWPALFVLGNTHLMELLVLIGSWTSLRIIRVRVILCKWWFRQPDFESPLKSFAPTPPGDVCGLENGQAYFWSTCQCGTRLICFSAGAARQILVMQSTWTSGKVCLLRMLRAWNDLLLQIWDLKNDN